MSLEIPVQTIMVPGRGLVNLDAMRVDTAVKEYDERLSFGYNPVNEDWVVYIALPRDYEGAHYHIDGEPVMPVLGFQGRIPSPEEVTRRLYETDAWRNGEEIYNKMLENNERIKKEQREKSEAEMEEAIERAAHVLNHFTGEGTTKVFFNGTKRRVGYRVGKRDGNRS